MNRILKEMVKVPRMKKSKNKDKNVFELEKAKRMYSVSLRGSVGKSDGGN
jgi:hypothetical protein